MIDYQKIAKKIKSLNLNEDSRPSIGSYIQSITEILHNIRPSSKSDLRRIEVAQQHMREVRKSVRRLEERLNVLEEQIKILEEVEEKWKLQKKSY